MLTDMHCRTAKPRERLYRLNDRDGLYLEVKPNGVKAFRYRFKLGGKESMMALGHHHDCLDYSRDHVRMGFAAFGVGFCGVTDMNGGCIQPGKFDQARAARLQQGVV